MDLAVLISYFHILLDKRNLQGTGCSTEEQLEMHSTEEQLEMHRRNEVGSPTWVIRLLREGWWFGRGGEGTEQRKLALLNAWVRCCWKELAGQALGTARGATDGTSIHQRAALRFLLPANEGDGTGRDSK